MGLAGDGGDALEVGVVVEHDELSGFCYCRHESIYQRKRPVLTQLSQEALHFDCSQMVGISGWNMGEGGQHFHEFTVIGRTSGAKSEFESYRGAHRDAPFCDQRGEYGGDDGL